LGRRGGGGGEGRKGKIAVASTSRPCGKGRSPRNKGKKVEKKNTPARWKPSAVRAGQAAKTREGGGM